MLSVYKKYSYGPILCTLLSLSLEIFSNIDNQIASLNIPTRIVGDLNVDVHKIRPP